MTATAARSKSSLWYTASLVMRRLAAIAFTTDNSHAVAASQRDAQVADRKPWHAS